MTPLRIGPLAGALLLLITAACDVTGPDNAIVTLSNRGDAPLIAAPYGIPGEHPLPDPNPQFQVKDRSRVIDPGETQEFSSESSEFRRGQGLFIFLWEVEGDVATLKQSREVSPLELVGRKYHVPIP